MIAIMVPATLRYLDRRAEERREQARASREQREREKHVLMIAHAYKRAGEVLTMARSRLNTLFVERTLGTARGKIDLQHSSRIAGQRAVVMRTLAQQPRMDERSIACLLAAAVALESVAALPEMPAQELGTFFGDVGHEFWLGRDELRELVGDAGDQFDIETISVFNTTFDTDGPSWR